jgi:hypothetical protein
MAAQASSVELQAAIEHDVAEHNGEPKPVVWTADPDRTLAAIKHGKQALESVNQVGPLSLGVV